MPLTPGQLIFAACFLVAFLIMLFWAYRKDIKSQKGYHKGGLKVLGLLVLLAASFYIMLRVLK